MADLRILVIANDPLAAQDWRRCWPSSRAAPWSDALQAWMTCPRWLMSIAPTYSCGT